jgi:quercetin dioxygenase-like cupin family protein
MKITRLYTGPDGASHFEDVDLPMNVGKNGRDMRTEVFPAKGIVFGEVGDSPFHKAPARQFGIVLKGQIEIIVGDGTSRVFKQGDVFLAEDMTGTGHRSSTKDLRIIFVTLE